MKEEKKKRIIRLVTILVVLAIIITAIVFIIYGLLPNDTSSGGHICEGGSCEIPI